MRKWRTQDKLLIACEKLMRHHEIRIWICKIILTINVFIYVVEFGVMIAYSWYSEMFIYFLITLFCIFYFQIKKAKHGRLYRALYALKEDLDLLPDNKYTRYYEMQYDKISQDDNLI